MKRTPLIAGNWKMNLSLDEAVGLIRKIVSGIIDLKGVEVLVAPPFTSLWKVREAIGDSKVFLAAQNMYYEASGAYTGEISGAMLKEGGCTHVILGHSERRMIFHETSEMIDLKVKAAVMSGLIPIVCVGETLDEREAGKTFEVVQEQLDQSLKSLRADRKMPASMVLAYEPVWAIGTGRTATPNQAQEVHGFIREWIERGFGAETADRIRILYGGSVKGENIRELMAQPDIDGGLVGGASLKADAFLPIIRFGSP